MRINCLSCGHKVDLDEAYDDYEGQVKCWACSAMLDIKTEGGKLRVARLANPSVAPRTAMASEHG
jgi:ribosomal protein S27E